MYNIFKPHIVEKEGNYSVRKYDAYIFEWVHLELVGNYWWMTGCFVEKFCTTGDLALAQQRLDDFNKEENKVVEDNKWRRVK